MNLGMLVRADNRGLGLQTWEAYRHLSPVRTLVIDMEGSTPYEQHFDRYPDAWGRFRAFDQDPQILRPFLDGLDVLYTAETPYRDELLTIAREMGVATVIQGNFEFLRWRRDPYLPRPDLFLAPSDWRLGDWPEPTCLLPFPVDRERLPFEQRTCVETFLHVAGHPTRADRNGTMLFLQALTHVYVPMRVIVTAQDAIPTSLIERVPACIDCEVRIADAPDYWRLYDEGDVLVLPRRFGGLSLPMNEAMSRGMPVVSLDMSPQNAFLPPESLVPARIGRWFDAQSDRIDIADGDPVELAALLMGLATDPELVQRLSRQADAHAATISWEALGPVYERTLEEVAASRRLGV